MSEKKLFHEVPKSADFHSVVMTTYSFDFHHFESQVLRPLKSKGITNVTIFADTAMLDQSIGFSTGHLKALSTSYSINGIPSLGAFHPKVTILAGENDVLLLQGSGNITNGGHGKNHETFTVFYANTEDKTQLPLIQEAWKYIRQLTANIEGLSADKLSWVSSNCNLLHEKPVQLHQWHPISEHFSVALLYNEETSIWQQLSEKLTNEEVKNIKLFSPFYDEKGTLLKQLHTSFPQCQIQAFLQPDKGIHPFKMELHKSVSFLSWDSTDRVKAANSKLDRKLHSKVFWFDCGDQQYGLFGSPNATIKAFGTNTSRGANDEFAVLLKVNNQDILKELQLTGSFEQWTPQENKQIQEIEDEIEEEQAKNTHKIKLLGVDQDNKQLTLYIRKTNHYNSATIVCYNNWGEEIERQKCNINTTKIRLQLNEKSNSLAFVLFIDDKENVISNKQIVNKLHELWNTNPSVENRRLMKLGSLIESGSSKLFDIITFFNDIQSSNGIKQSNSSSSSNEDKKDKENISASISYEEAIQLVGDSKENQQILSKHNSIQIWDAIERYFNQLTTDEEEEDMDDEEEGEATSSRERKDKKRRTAPVIFNSEKVLGSRRKAFDKFLNNYLKALQKSLKTKNYQINQVDLAMFLIVMKHLIEYTEREVIFKVSSDSTEKKILFPISGNLSENSSFSGALLNIIGHFVNLINKSSFLVIDDEYLLKKQEHYKVMVKRTALFSLAIIKEVYKYHEKGSKWADILAFNILKIFGDLEDEVNNHLEEFLKNTSIENLEAVTLFIHLEKWKNDFSKGINLEEVFLNNKLGVCYILKRIPSQGNIKFLKLGRPGFTYQEKENDFILDELYNVETDELMKSLKSIKK